MLQTLPVEILSMIFKFVEDKKTLYTLLFVSHPVHSLVEAILYADACVTANDIEGFETRIEGLLQRIIADNRRLALYVKEFAVFQPLGKFSPRHSFADSVLPLLVNLKRLKLRYIQGPAFDPSVLKPSRYQFELTHLVLDVSTNLDALGVFLVSQPSLEYLELIGVEPSYLTISLPPGALPNLRMLDAPYNIVLNILPGRNVSDLGVVNISGRVGRTFDPAFIQAFNKIQSLSFAGTEFELPDIFTLASDFCHLKYFKLEITGTIYLEWIDHCIAMLQLAKMQYLQLICDEAYPSLEPVIATMFNTVPNLCLIDVSGGVTGDTNWYRYHLRDLSPRSAKIPVDEWEPWWYAVKEDVEELELQKGSIEVHGM